MRRNQVTKLPKPVKDWLDRALAEKGFSEYEALALELNGKGFAISKSAIHRYGQKFQQRVGEIKTATEMARVIIEANPDDDNSQNEALIRLAQERLMTALVDMDTADSGKLVKATRAIADIARASVSQKRFREEVLAKAKSAADKVAKMARRGGLSDDAADEIRRAILGIAE
jgi:hypothetical protein